MPKYRKMLTDINAEYLQILMRIIETQSIATITTWCTEYARKNLLPLWYEEFEDDLRPEFALGAAQNYIAGKIDLKNAKLEIMQVRDLARTLEKTPIAQGVARAVDSSASSIHNPAGSLGVALYGALAIAYHKEGLNAPWEVLEKTAEKECYKMIEALQMIAVENEPKPAKIKWGC